MIARHWRGVVRREQADEYVLHLRARTLPELERIPGFVDASIQRRAADGGVEFLVVTRWESRAAIERFAGADAEAAVVPDGVRRMLVEGDDRARHYEMLAADPEPSTRAYALRAHGAGDIGWVVQRHAELYEREYGWGPPFEALVAEIAARFLREFDPARERCWIAERDEPGAQREPADAQRDELGAARGRRRVGSVFLV
ncbi:MAG: hypothetical protein EPO68_15525, partial [Planctomycetota bacterium]